MTHFPSETLLKLSFANNMITIKKLSPQWFWGVLTKSSYYIETTRVGMNVFNLSMKGERAHAQEKRAAIQKSPVENFTITDKV